ncbi:MAG: rod shape-determining protein MreC [Desulfobacteraceae bacterium]|nr:rod shape-determining protein MreC [Desulfobacteraceae bacterium]MBC2718582.1 rod shape-determining protein MreC [Desulfobacteraceae bacterium]
MFSKKMVIIFGAVALIVVNIIILSVNSSRYFSYGSGRSAIFFIAPFQKTVTQSVQFLKNIWGNYFFLVSVEKENADLKRTISRAIDKNNKYREIEISNFRLRNLLDFRKTMTNQVLVAEVVGQDPSPWFKTIIIDKGKSDGVEKGLPVVVPEGIAGQIIDISCNYSKVLLIIDRNSAVDALVQRTRDRGLIKGQSDGRCLSKYVLRKHDIKVGDTVVSSGLDGLFPKGLRVGYVTEIVKRNSGIFQEVTVMPYVDFEKLEEVLVVLDSPKHDFVSEQ